MTPNLRKEVPGLPSSNQVRTTPSATGTGPTPTRHQDSPPEQNPPGPRKLKEQELSASTGLDASQLRLHGPRRESAPPPRPSTRVSTASTALDASQLRLHGPRTRVSTASAALDASQHLVTSTSSTPHNQTWNQTYHGCSTPAYQAWSASEVHRARLPETFGAATQTRNRACPRHATPASTGPMHCPVKDPGELFTRCPRHATPASTGPTHCLVKDPGELATRRRRTHYRRTDHVPRCRTHATSTYYSRRQATATNQGAWRTCTASTTNNMDSLLSISTTPCITAPRDPENPTESRQLEDDGLGTPPARAA